MELHESIAEDRIQELCDRFIADSVDNNKYITEEDCRNLSVTELIVLIMNTKWYVTRIKDDKLEICNRNILTLATLIKEEFSKGELYTIYSNASNMPYITDENTILVYTNKSNADLAAASLNTEYSNGGFGFNAVVFKNGLELWSILRSIGVTKVNAEGTKYIFDIPNTKPTNQSYETTDFCRAMIKYAQCLRIKKFSDKSEQYRALIITALKKNPTLYYGHSINNDNAIYKPVYTYNKNDAGPSALNTFSDILADFKLNEELVGIVLNPDREHIIIPRDVIEKEFVAKTNSSDKDSFKSNNKINKLICTRCGCRTVSDNMNSAGYCKKCAEILDYKQSIAKNIADFKEENSIMYLGIILTILSYFSAIIAGLSIAVGILSLWRKKHSDIKSKIIIIACIFLSILLTSI